MSGSLAGLGDDIEGLTGRARGGASGESCVNSASLSVSSEIDWKSSSST